MVYKSGAIFAKKISEFFDPHSLDHLRAWVFRQEEGHWPSGFPGVDVYEDCGWEKKVLASIHQKYPPEIYQWKEEYRRLQSVICGMPNLSVHPIADQFYIRSSSGGVIRKFLIDFGEKWENILVILGETKA